MSAQETTLESYRTAEEQFVVYESGKPCAFIVSETTVDPEYIR